MTKGLEFDPGFGPYILAFRGAVEYIYMDINKFKNFSQRKIKFTQCYKKILEIFNNNLGFYIGCIMWAAYIKTKEEQELLNNHCLGQKYNEEENAYDIDFTIRFLELFPKDMKYFLGQCFEFKNNEAKILEIYREFLVINKAFVESKKNTDILLPKGVKTENAESFKEIIDKVIETQDLSKLIEYKELIL